MRGVSSLSFAPFQNYGAGSSPRSVAVGDFNADGKLDLAIANSGSANVSILLGVGDGTFQTHVDYAAGSGPISVAVGDFNADGKLDLAISNYNSDNVSILLGVGDGTFQTHVDYAAGSGPSSVAVGDFNADGKLDLAIPNFGNANVSILLGVGNGTFLTHVDYAAGSFPYSVAVGDFNADGKLDLAAANYGSANVSILLNTSTCTTFTATPTATPAVTNTPLATNTPIAPTATPTATPAVTNTPLATNTPIAPTPTDCSNQFVDINGNIFYVAIHYLNCHGVVNGVDATHFAPSGTATRDQFTKIVVLASGAPLITPVAGPTFADVPASYWAYRFIESAYAAGIIAGYQSCNPGPCYFHPHDFITRGQLTKIVVNAFHIPLLTPSAGPTFTDVLPGSIFYEDIESAHAAGLINGYADHTFRPDNNIRRDEMSQILYEAVIHQQAR